ncbi:GTPase IMAP family member 8-like [Branchiostoma floridae x Branchiostoma japonicum]
MDPTEKDPTTTLQEINRCRQKCPNGVNALLLVTRCDQKFTEEEKTAIQHLEILFGEELFNYGIVIFTHGDAVDRAKEDGEVNSFEEFLSSRDQPPYLKHVLHKVGQRYVVFNNRLKENEAKRQRRELLDTIRRGMTNQDPYRIPEVSERWIRLNLCFPATSTVLVDGKHQGKMASLQVGTEVVSVTQDDSPRANLDTVYFFSHAAEDVLAPFVRITTAGGKTLHLSEGHYIYVGRDALKTGALVTAREVKVGDLVHVVDAMDLSSPR